MRYYPLFLDIRGRRVVMIGGGAVAERKTASLLKAGAKVKVISPAFTPRLAAWGAAKKIRTTRRRYRRGDLKGAALAFVATDDHEVNRAVASEAMEKGIWINRAAAGPSSAPNSFIVPALYSKGDLLIAVSTGGKSPALAKRLRDDLKRFLIGAPKERAKTLARIKRALIRKKVDSKRRRDLLTRLADPTVPIRKIDLKRFLD